jgi:hypothetical protein
MTADQDDAQIHAVAFEHGGRWVAQCLEYDIATQASTLDDLLYEFERILVAHILGADGADPFANLSPAPRSFWEMYDRAVTKVAPVRPFPMPDDRRPSLEIRKAAA